MITFIRITLQLLRLAWQGKLPAPLRKWKLSTRHYISHGRTRRRKPMRLWSWSAIGYEVEDGYAFHMLNVNGLWDCIEEKYLFE